MRQILCLSALILSALAFGGDGRPPRASGSEYPVHQDLPTATIAAVRISPEQLNKNFPADFAKKYIVVEVAIYPKDGSTFHVALKDFSLKLGAEGESHPESAEEVAWIWRPHNSPHPDMKQNTHVTTESGVVYANGRDPATGKRVNSVGTYEAVGVGVGDDPNRPAPAPKSSSVDADRLQAKLDDWILQEGKTSSPVAGYLYFPLPAKKTTKGPFELQYEHDDASAKLTLPAPSK